MNAGVTKDSVTEVYATRTWSVSSCTTRPLRAGVSSPFHGPAFCRWFSSLVWFVSSQVPTWYATLRCIVHFKKQIWVWFRTMTTCYCCTTLLFCLSGKTNISIWNFQRKHVEAALARAALEQVAGQPWSSWTPGAQKGIFDQVPQAPGNQRPHTQSLLA